MKSYSILHIFCITIVVIGNAYPPSQALFTSRDNVTEALVALINQEQQTIKIATATITSKPIQDALLRAKMRGIDIEIIVDKEWVDNNPAACKCITALEQQNIPIFKYKAGHRAFPSIMHNKFGCFYRTTQQQCCAVATGSFNYTNQANINCENIIINYEPHIFDEYLIEFERLKKRILSQPDLSKKKKSMTHPSFNDIKRTHHALRHTFKGKKWTTCTDLF